MAARRLAAENAISYFAFQLRNPSFLRIASNHHQDVNQPQLLKYKGDRHHERNQVTSSVGRSLNLCLVGSPNVGLGTAYRAEFQGLIAAKGIENLEIAR